MQRSKAKTRRRHLTRAIALVIAAVTVWTPTDGSARSATPEAQSATVDGDTNKTRFVVGLSKRVGFSAFTLPDPYRVIIDLPAVKFALPPALGRQGKGLIKAFRYGLFAEGQSRIVIDTSGPVKIKPSMVKAGRQMQLVIDLVPTSRAAFLTQSRATPRLKLPQRAQKSEIDKLINRSRRSGKKIVVLDPGHGGIDSGAIGYGGTPEKEVILSFGKILKKRLEKSGRYTVFMTRQKDVFVPLRERVAFARRRRADLFLSIHADSISRRYAQRVRGATIYTLSERASDREAQELAAKENKSDIIAGVDIPKVSDVVTNILIDLAQRETNNLSSVLATKLETSMKTATKVRGSKSAAFVVLKAPDVPSALLELGFLTNRRDEQLLKSRRWQEKVTKTVEKAIDRFFATATARLPY